MADPNHFRRILDARLRTAEVRDGEHAPAWYRVHGLGVVAEQTAGASRIRHPAELYAEQTQPRQRMCGADDGDGTGELHLAPDLTTEQLKRVRRTYAMANHPDRAPPELRDIASRRMAVANGLIDQALRAAGKR
jgi:hypothetical protein